MGNKSVFYQDLYRYYGDAGESLKRRLFRDPQIRFLYCLRKASESKGLSGIYYKLRLKRISHRTNMDIPCTCKIGPGFYIGHCGNIIINPQAVIGSNVNIATGVTIGQENRGKRQGTPTIGDNCWIGTNAVIVGKVNIGSDVLIAPLTYVNFDVPDHSIVVGNPGRIIPRDHATEGYLNRTV